LTLEDSGLFQVEKYTDPMLVLSILKPGIYDFVLIGLMIPNIDSIELYEKMRKIDSDLKVCFIGIYENEESHQALIEQFPSLEPSFQKKQE
jgi:PleD family two-component response regulator